MLKNIDYILNFEGYVELDYILIFEVYGEEEKLVLRFEGKVYLSVVEF